MTKTRKLSTWRKNRLSEDEDMSDTEAVEVAKSLSSFG
jgi:hypothetical protein